MQSLSLNLCSFHGKIKIKMTISLKILNEISLTESDDDLTSVFGDPSSFSSTKLTGAPFDMLHKLMWTFKTRRSCLISEE